MYGIHVGALGIIADYTGLIKRVSSRMTAGVVVHQTGTQRSAQRRSAVRGTKRLSATVVMWTSRCDSFAL